MARTAPSIPGLPDLVGGHIAVDLVNTVSWRDDPSRWRDNLTDVAALLAWCQRAGALDERTADALRAAGESQRVAPARALQRVIDLREDLAGVLVALMGSDTAPDADIEGTGSSEEVMLVPSQLHARLVDALTCSDLIGVPGRWRITVHDLGDVPRLLSLHALDLLQSRQLSVLRRCQGGGCGWLFLDRSRSHTRRYCSSGDCGNRDRARRHYARHHSGQSKDADRASSQ